MGTLVLAGATSGSTTLTPVDAVTTVLTLPSATATLATLGANTFTGNQSITGTLGVTGNATFDTNTMFVDAANNRVGIGTATPSNILDIQDATNYALNQSVANVTIWTTTAMGIDVGGSIGFGGKYSSTSSISWADIHGKKENATDNNAAGYLAFLTRDNSVGNLERMRISSIGAVTIPGTLGVGGKTHIGSGASGDTGGYLQIEEDTPTALMNIDFQMYNYSGATKMGGMRFYVQDQLRAQIDSYTDDFTAKGDLRFYTSTGGTMTQNMTLGTSGDLTVTGQVSASAIAGNAIATQANQETATSTTTVVSPGRQQFHPSAAKAWVRYQTVTTTTNIASYNVASLTDNGTGDTTITFTTNFSSGTSYNGVFMGRQDSVNINVVIVPAANYTASTVRVLTYNSDPSPPLRDYEIVCGTMFGDQ